ncbi:unnamed protein product [Brassica rapa subsp. trilocularis]
MVHTEFTNALFRIIVSSHFILNHCILIPRENITGRFPYSTGL